MRSAGGVYCGQLGELLRRQLLIAQRHGIVLLPYLVGRPWLATFIEQATIAPGHEQFRRSSLDLLPEQVVILVYKVDDEGKFALLRQVEEFAVIGRLLLRRPFQNDL